MASHRSGTLPIRPILPLLPVRPVLPVLGILLVSVLPGGEGGRLAAQEAPPPDEIRLPERLEASLPHGLRVVAASAPGQEAAALLLFRGGTSLDARGREGTAALVAGLLSSSEGVAAAADGDALVVSATGTGAGSDEVLDRVATALAAPLPDASALSLLRSSRIDSLEARMENPDVLADRRLVETVYGGDHPYGRLETAETLGGVTPAALESWRERSMAPGNALLVVIAPGSPEDILEGVRERFARWPVPGVAGAGGVAGAVEAAQGWDAPPPGARRPPGTGPTVEVVHVPRAERAVIHAGHLLPAGDHEDWTALAVLDRMLGGGVQAELFTLETSGGETVMAGAQSAAQRRAGPGLFRIRAAVGPEAVGLTLDGLLAELRAAQERFPGPDAFARSRDVLAVSFPLQIEGADRLAALLGVNRLLGVPDSALATYPGRVRRLGPQDIRDAAREHLRPEELAVTVVGDAPLILESLEGVAGLGRVRVVDRSGAELDPAVLAPPPELLEVDAGSLHPLTLRYRLLVGGREAGSMERALARDGGDTLRYTGRATFAGRSLEQEVRFTVPGFRPVSTESGARAGEEGAALRLRAEGDRLRGTLRGGPDVVRVDAPLPPGAVVGDMLELAVQAAPLEVGREWRIPLITPESGSVAQVRVRVEAEEEVTVPAGTFRTWRVRLSGAESQILWIRREIPRVPVRVQQGGQPLVFELVELAEPAEPDGG